ncbi:OLC1v1023438C1 [Oldenlandia corymbosa var. corymbosa]|uniref:Dirigent protein n=1 Tax=Oldenlandia corymbosa var. corymbosa TaxID=529605 RepID=A0AAV1C0A6_OLDCO|nr:OLC1v1023438C1 [Oldenlandia corymbosa var. corymbosa]
MVKLSIVLLATLMAMAPLLIMASRPGGGGEGGYSDLDRSPYSVERWFKRLRHAREKLTRLHFFFQDKVSGKRPTAEEIARANVTSESPTFFGLTRVFDDPLTVGPSPHSKTIGHGQGIYSLTSQEDLSLLFSFNFVFTEGKYKGSTISVQGRNPLSAKYREMPIIGGTGAFRLAKGSAILSTFWSNETSQDGIVEFTLMVVHYEELKYDHQDIELVHGF